MKKLLNTALTYAILGLCGGVFYREFTKFNGFTGRTTLGFVHLHLLVLGMFFFLLIALFEKQYHLTNGKHFRLFYLFYNVGMGITTVTFLWRGVLQVLATPVSGAVSASLSGIAGIGHILVGTGLILFLFQLKKAALKTSKAV